MSFYAVISADVERSSSGYDIFGNKWDSYGEDGIQGTEDDTPETYTLVYGWSDDQGRGTGRHGWIVMELTNLAATGEMKIKGTDLFGMRYDETITNTYFVKFGRALVSESRVEHSGWDMFGSDTTAKTTSTNTWGITEFEGNKVVIITKTRIEREQSGSDIFGNEWKTAKPEIYEEHYDFIKGTDADDKPVYWQQGEHKGEQKSGWAVKNVTKIQNMEISGTDSLGIPYTEIIDNTYSADHGKALVINSATTRSGSDMFGNNTTSTTTLSNTWGVTDFEGRRVKITTSASKVTISSGADVFGISFAETNTVNYEYGMIHSGVQPKFQDTYHEGDNPATPEEEINGYSTREPIDEGAIREGWGITSASGTVTGQSSTIFGDPIETEGKQEYTLVHGEPVLINQEITTREPNIFGDIITTEASTKKNYGQIVFDGETYFNIVSQVTITHSSEIDVFGNLRTTKLSPGAPEVTAELYGITKEGVWGVVGEIPIQEPEAVIPGSEGLEIPQVGFPQYNLYLPMISKGSADDGSDENSTTSGVSFYAYHPLSSADSSTFDDITLDTGAYEFIDRNINLEGENIETSTTKNYGETLLEETREGNKAFNILSRTTATHYSGTDLFGEQWSIKQNSGKPEVSVEIFGITQKGAWGG